MFSKVSSTFQEIKSLVLIIVSVMFSLPMWAIWEDSGEGMKVDGTWYVLYEENENSINTIGNKSFDLLGPGSQITFEAKRTPTGLKNLKVTDGTTKFFDENPGTVVKKILGIESQVDYTTYGPYDINMDATSIKFYTETGATFSKYFKNIKVTMAQYLEGPSRTALDFGSALVQTDDVVESFSISWCNVPAMSYEITGDDKDQYEVAVVNNATEGKYNTATFTVTYKRNKVGVHNATLVISDGYGNYNKSVSLTGTTEKLPTIEEQAEDWICDGDIYIYHNYEYLEAGEYSIEAVGEIRDTVYVLNLTVREPSSSSEEMTITYGEEKVWNEMDLSKMTVGIHEITYTTTNAVGCDSVVTLNLTVNKQETLEERYPIAICKGDTFTFREVEYKEEGVYSIDAVGETRDTAYVFEISVLEPSASSEEMTITYGEEKVWNEMDLSEMIVGMHEMTYTTTNAVGCDSVVTLNLTVNKMENLEVPVLLSICTGDSTYYREKKYTNEDLTDVIFAEGETRDTIYNISIEVLPTYIIEDVQERYTDEKLVWEEKVFEDLSEGTYYDTVWLSTAAGCDSIRTLVYTVTTRPTTYGTYEAAICAGDSVEIEGQWYNEAMEAIEVLSSAKNIYGGDSIITLSVVVYPVDMTDLYEDTLRVGDELVIEDYTWQVYNEQEGVYESVDPGTYTMTTTGEAMTLYSITKNVYDCDSTVVRHIIVIEKEDVIETALDLLNAEVVAVKELRNGVIYIRREEGLYSLDGRKVE